jgi:hypothetical protein
MTAGGPRLPGEAGIDPPQTRRFVPASHPENPCRTNLTRRPPVPVARAPARATPRAPAARRAAVAVRFAAPPAPAAPSAVAAPNAPARRSSRADAGRGAERGEPPRRRARQAHREMDSLISLSSRLLAPWRFNSLN